MVSFNAFKNATAKKPLKNKDGFTADQRFFLAYAGVWGQNINTTQRYAHITNQMLSSATHLLNYQLKGLAAC
jgi:putative endopeptidase